MRSRPEGTGRIPHGRRDRRAARDVESRGDAGEIQSRALARRRRGPFHRPGSRAVSRPPVRYGPVFAIEVEAGDLIRVPRGTHHGLISPRRSAYPRDPSVPGSRNSGLDAPLYRDRHRPSSFNPSFWSRVRRVVRLSVSAGAASARIQAILLDIEGTTTPIAFVHDVLFLYARLNLRRHLEQRASSPEYAFPCSIGFRDEHAGDRTAGQGRAAVG